MFAKNSIFIDVSIKHTHRVNEVGGCVVVRQYIVATAIHEYVKAFPFF